MGSEDEVHSNKSSMHRHEMKDAENTNNNSCSRRLYRYIEAQTSLPSLILYAYLFWYLFIMICFGIKHMPLIAWLNAAVLATFVCITLNAAAYTAPACGTNGYFKHPFKVSRFWMIPFCVSSISVACNASKDECLLLFPTDTTLLIIHLFTMTAILSIGSFIHCFILPKCACHKNKNVKGHKIKSKSEIDIDGSIGGVSEASDVIHTSSCAI